MDTSLRSEQRKLNNTWTKLQEEISMDTAVATAPVYRVLRLMEVAWVSGEPEVLWEGSDLSEALKKFPLFPEKEKMGLTSFWTDPEEMMEIRDWWEKRNPTDADSTWERCPDPRYGER